VRRSSSAISRPSASAPRSTFLVGHVHAAKFAQKLVPSAKLTDGADQSDLRVTAGDSDVFSSGERDSRGQTPASHTSQW